MKRQNRRRFLWLTAGTGTAIGVGAAAFLLQPDQRDNGNGASNEIVEFQSASRTSWALGSEVTMTALHRDKSMAESAIDAAFDELALVEELMTIYRPDSQVSCLNRDCKLNEPHPYLLDILKCANTISARSGGAFDITVQPLWQLYADAKANGDLPKSDAVEQARQLVDWRRVAVAKDRVELSQDGMAITLNGIAQGYAADKARDALTQRGIDHALIDTGELGSIGNKPDGKNWTVGIQHPRHDDAYIGLAKLDGRCLATSGDYATSFSDDMTLNHLFDPRTGRSPEEFSSVSVVADSAMMADALSTAVFVMGPEEGLKLIRKTPKADAMFVLKDGRTFSTDGFPVQA